MLRKIQKFILPLVVAFTICTLVGIFSAFYLINHYSKGLPNHEQLRAYDPPITTRLYAKDGRLLKEYAKEKRLFLPIEAIPDMVKQAFLSAEDSKFYEHSGIDFEALIGAVIYNTGAFLSGNQMRGASTITQQVVKNMLLSKERTITRKIKEAILAFRITKAFSKDEVLELYLNQIYLGNKSYGVGAAALNYFNKSVDELTVEEAAMLAALPKAPGRLDPRKNYELAKGRRDWVIKRMRIDGHISGRESRKAQEKPIEIVERGESEVVNANYFAEAVRRELVKAYGENVLLEDGYVVTTTLDPKLQKTIDKYFKEGIEAYDMKHGYRGAIGRLRFKKNFNKEWPQLLEEFEIGSYYNPAWERAVILKVDDKNKQILIGLSPVRLTEENEEELMSEVDLESEFVEIREEEIVYKGFIPLKHLTWARKYINIDTIGFEIKKPSNVGLRRGQIILVKKSDPEIIKAKKEGEEDVVIEHENEYMLRQIPEVNGGAIAMDPHTGRILAIMGGYLDSETGFNRVTQAQRQPGSILKTFAYLTALENGFTPAHIIMDEEIELDQGYGLPPYIPRNYSEKFFGPTTLRMGLEKSRNVTTVRMADEVGLDKVVEVIKRFGLNEDPEKIYSIVLGSTETNLIKLTRAYSMIINGGKVIRPTIIEKIQNKHGQTVFKRDNRDCEYCIVKGKPRMKKVLFPVFPDMRETIVDEATAYQVTSLLEGVVKRGTGWKARAIGKPVGGKTGTTNNWFDSWFVGFTPDLVVGVYIGFDQPRTLGTGETGSSVASPIFVNIMKEALEGKPSTPFRVPSSVKFVRIDRNTGTYPTPLTKPQDVIFEVLKLEDDLGDKNKNIKILEDALGSGVSGEKFDTPNRNVDIMDLIDLDDTGDINDDGSEYEDVEELKGYY
jgi:penicillin-binding protein 1A